MTATEFAKKYQVNGKDLKVIQRVYGNVEKTEDEWGTTLKGKISFDESKFDKMKKIREAKIAKNSSKSKK